MNRPLQPTEPSPRIDPRQAEEMRPEWLDTLARLPGAGLRGAGFPHNCLGTLMISEETFGPFLEYWVTCKERMSLSAREQELVILRMGVLYASNYVWMHHVPVGREFGVTDDELEALRAGYYEGFSDRERALLALADELVEARTIRREIWDACSPSLGEIEIVELVNLVAQYVLFALINNAAQVSVEEGLAGTPAIDDPITAPLARETQAHVRPPSGASRKEAKPGPGSDR
jgi:4-carboxymuconolactone decarboxylase